ncbi:hypothetical protein FRC02_000997 [Tulasnella sp. 418]|nr:hypothetical protein FRC02_000997 [Tulasnella sp. 418]
MGHRYLSLEAANIIGVFVGAVLFGLYTSLVSLAMIYIRRRRTGSRVVPLLLIAIWIVTATSTAFRMSSICFAFGKEEDHLGYFQKKKFTQKYAAIVSTLQTISVSCARTTYFVNSTILISAIRRYY